MKTKRHNKILELISNQNINTQKLLLEKLRSENYDVTQATVSRDIKELGIHKVRNSNGKYCYIPEKSIIKSNLSDKFSMIFAQSVIDVDYANNIIVIKCHTGMANAACATFDALEMENVVGTLSGDDTFIVIMRDEDSARTNTEKLK
ncbi:MAG: arginine repressor, partial [Oscillospiraceae bacterium]